MTEIEQTAFAICAIGAIGVLLVGFVVAFLIVTVRCIQDAKPRKKQKK